MKCPNCRKKLKRKNDDLICPKTQFGRERRPGCGFVNKK